MPNFKELKLERLLGKYNANDVWYLDRAVYGTRSVALAFFLLCATNVFRQPINHITKRTFINDQLAFMVYVNDEYELSPATPNDSVLSNALKALKRCFNPSIWNAV